MAQPLSIPRTCFTIAIVMLIMSMFMDCADQRGFVVWYAPATVFASLAVWKSHGRLRIASLCLIGSLLVLDVLAFYLPNRSSPTLSVQPTKPH